MDELLHAAPETLKAWADADGFTARLYPQPDLNLPLVGGGVLGWLLFCGAVAWLAGRGDPTLSKLLFGALGIFGLLLYAFHHGRGFFPVEVSACRGQVFFAGDRLPTAMVRGCDVEGEALLLRDVDGSERGRIDHLPASATGWVQRAVATYLSSAAEPT